VIGEFPVLSAAEEASLPAADVLATKNLKLVASLARKHSQWGRTKDGRTGDRLGMEFDDLFSEAYLAMRTASARVVDGRTRARTIGRAGFQAIHGALMWEVNQSFGTIQLPAWLVKGRASIAKHFPDGISGVSDDDIIAKVNFGKISEDTVREGLALLRRKACPMPRTEPASAAMVVGFAPPSSPEAFDRVQELLEATTKEQRSAVVLRFGIRCEALTYPEIAETIGTSEKMAQHLVREGIRRMARAAARYQPQPTPGER
jgi:hypothetical protein